MMREKFSVVIITKNEEKFIADAINSASFADEILVLDSGSSDKTEVICKSMNINFIYQEWLGFGAQKNKAINLAKNDWIFVLDADERITEDLKIEILEKLKCHPNKSYFVPRLNNFFGKDIRFCGLYPDYSIRLFNRNHGEFSNVAVHESFKTKVSTEKLENHIYHLAYSSVKEFKQKQNFYSSLSDVKRNFLRGFFSALWAFLKIYFIKLGFLEGWRGIVIAAIYSKYSFNKYFR